MFSCLNRLLNYVKVLLCNFIYFDIRKSSHKAKAGNIYTSLVCYFILNKIQIYLMHYFRGPQPVGYGAITTGPWKWPVRVHTCASPVQAGEQVHSICVSSRPACTPLTQMELLAHGRTTPSPLPPPHQSTKLEMLGNSALLHLPIVGCLL